MIYVTMTDKFMSGWGHSNNKINKLVFECDSKQEAFTVMENAEKRGDQKHINIATNRPSYPAHSHYTQFKTKEDYPKWYEEGAF